MAREVQTLLWCDICHEQYQLQIPAMAAPVSIGDTLLRDLDLCAKHREQVARAVRKVLPKKYARKRDVAERPGPFRCQVEGCSAHPLRHRRTLWQHVKLFHQMTMAEYREEYGDLVPMTRQEVAELSVVARCDEDECEQEYSTATGTRWPRQALVSHMRGRHGLKLTRDGRKVSIL